MTTTTKTYHEVLTADGRTVYLARHNQCLRKVAPPTHTLPDGLDTVTGWRQRGRRIIPTAAPAATFRFKAPRGYVDSPLYQRGDTVPTAATRRKAVGAN